VCCLSEKKQSKLLGLTAGANGVNDCCVDDDDVVTTVVDVVICVNGVGARV